MSTLCLRESIWHRDLINYNAFIRARATAAFRQLQASDRDDAINYIVADITVEFAQLSQRRMVHRGLIPPLLAFAIRRRHAGRRVGTPVNRQDLQSPARQDAQPVLSLDSHNDASGVSWHDV